MSNTMGIVGLGRVGTHIAVTCARAGQEVRIFDQDWGQTRAAVKAGQHSPQLVAVDRIEQLAGSDVLIEAVPEHRAVKAEVLDTLAELSDADTLLVTTTSAFTVTELAAGLAAPPRLIGLHVMPAAPGTDLAEVVPGDHTSDTAVAQLSNLVVRLGWKALTVKDTPGRLTRRLLMPFLNQVVQAYDDGLASAEDIDKVAKLGLGHRRGPLAVLDAIGLDDHLAATQEAFNAVHDPALAAPPLLARMVAAGKCGQRSGSGFRYPNQEQA